MESILSEALAEMGINLTTLAVKGTVSAVNTKIKAIKNERDIERVKTNYDEIINELLSEREEAIRIAQAYKHEVESYEISDESIKHLHNTIEQVLEILKVMSPEMPIDTFEQVKGFVTVDTLKSMQLLGFNYKSAIGEPLTELCAKAILSRLSKPNKSSIPKSKR